MKALALLAAIALAACEPVLAHQAPSGWEYPTACCSNKDCHPADVQLVKGGFLIVETGEVIPTDDKRVKISGDGEFHRCGTGSWTRCLFIPMTA